MYRAFISAVIRTSAEKEKATKPEKSSRSSSQLKSKCFLVNLALTVARLLFVVLEMNVSSDGEVNSFDPFHILGVDYGADTMAIKKAYKKMSLMYRPYKIPNNPAAEAKFMMVAKAYEAFDRSNRQGE